MAVKDIRLPPFRVLRKFGQISSVTFGALADAVLLTTVLAEKRYRSYTRIVEVDTL